MSENKYEFTPHYAVPPGATLSEIMEFHCVTPEQVIEKSEFSIETLRRILKGDEPITSEIAQRLELATGVSARIWDNLEKLYRKQLKMIAERERSKNEEPDE